MTLRKQNQQNPKHTARHKLSKAVKPLFSRKPKSPTRPVHATYVTPASTAEGATPREVANEIDDVASRVKISSIAKEAKRPNHSLDVVSPAAPLPSATSRPVINGGQPLIRKRTMLNSAPAAMAASDAIQTAASDAQPNSGTTKLEAPGNTPLLAKPGARPAKPLLSKPVAAGPTVAQLLDIKQKAATAKPLLVNDIAPPPKLSLLPQPSAPAATTVPAGPTPSLVKSTTPATASASAEPAPEGPKLQLLESTKPAQAASTDKKADEDNQTSNRLTQADKTPGDEKPAEAGDPEETKDKQAFSPTVEAEPSKPTAASLPNDKPGDRAEANADGADSLPKDADAENAASTPPPKAELYGGRPVVIIHEAHPVQDFFKGLFVFILGLIVIAAAVNFLLDAGIIKTGYEIPHTNLLAPK